MPPTGHPTKAEFSLTVAPDSTTVSFSSVLALKAGKSRTHGELAGENQDTLLLAQETLAVSAQLLHIQTNDLHNPNIILNN